MKTFSQIFELKNQIENLTTKFGFKSDIKILNNINEDNNLELLVEDDSDKHNSFKNIQFLKHKLIELTDCNVIVTNYSSLNTFARQQYLENSANFERASVEKLFQRNAEEILFKDNEKPDKLFLKVLNQANTYLDNLPQPMVNSTASTNTSLFKTKPENSTEEKKIDVNVSIIDDNVTLTFQLPADFKKPANLSIEERLKKLVAPIIDSIINETNPKYIHR